MSTTIRPETSKKSKYWIPKHRYYELLHWCRQYDRWQEEKRELYSQIRRARLDVLKTEHAINSSYVEGILFKMEKWDNKITVLEESAMEADPIMREWLILSVTTGRGYTYLREVKNMPHSKNSFYDSYRKFFWILDQKLD